MSYYRQSNGKYKVVVSYKKSDGKYGRVCCVAKNLRDAKERELLLIDKVKGNIPSKVTFGTLAEEFLKSLKGKLRTTTIQQYKNSLIHHILPYFANSRFQDITIEELRRWKREEEQKGFALETLWKGKKAINCVVEFAEREYGLSNSAFSRLENFKKNPDAVVEEKIRYWTLSEFHQFENVAKSDIENTSKASTQFMAKSSTFMLVALCFFSGLRRGEANVLQLSDFKDSSSAKPFLDIHRSVAQKAGKGMGYLITPPKSKMSIRKVPIPYELERIIREHILILSNIRGFSSEFYLVGGVRITPDETINHQFRIWQEEAHLPKITIHELRHSYATMLYNNGVSLNVIAKLMGHTITKVTELYSHTYDESLNSAIDTIDSMGKSWGNWGNKF